MRMRTHVSFVAVVSGTSEFSLCPQVSSSKLWTTRNSATSSCFRLPPWTTSSCFRLPLRATFLCFRSVHKIAEFGPGYPQQKREKMWCRYGLFLEATTSVSAHVDITIIIITFVVTTTWVTATSCSSAVHFQSCCQTIVRTHHKSTTWYYQQQQQQQRRRLVQASSRHFLGEHAGQALGELSQKIRDGTKKGGGEGTG